MAEETRSLIAYNYWRESTQRFDYFVTGLIGAGVAYIAQSYVPQKLGLNPSTLELLSLLILLSSFLCAFKRIEAIAESFKWMSHRLNATETFAGITEAQSKFPLFQDVKSGQVYNAVTAEQEKQKKRMAGEKAGMMIDKFVKQSVTMYQWRNRLLFGGFILLLTSKVLAAY